MPYTPILHIMLIYDIFDTRSNIVATGSKTLQSDLIDKIKDWSRGHVILICGSDSQYCCMKTNKISHLYNVNDFAQLFTSYKKQNTKC